MFISATINAQTTPYMYVLIGFVSLGAHSNDRLSRGSMTVMHNQKVVAQEILSCSENLW